MESIKLRRATNIMLIVFCMIIFFFITCKSAYAADRYGYSKMTDNNQKYVYNQINSVVASCGKASLDASKNITAADIKKAMEMLRADYPEYFYLTGSYSYGTSAGKIVEVTPEYKVNGVVITSIAASNSIFNTKVNQIISGMPATCNTDYKKAIYLHDKLIEIATNASGTDKNASSAYGAIVDGKAYTSGYSRAYQYLLNKAGVDAWYVFGDVSDISIGASGSCAWNLVWIDGDCCYTNVCFDDLSSGASHKFFNLSLAEISLTHTLGDDYVGKLPACSHGAHDYYTTESGNGTGVITDSTTSAEVAAMLIHNDNKYTGTFLYKGSNFAAWLTGDKVNGIISALGESGSFSYGYSSFSNEYYLTLTKVKKDNYSVMGTIKTWNGTNDAAVRLYNDSETNESIVFDIKSSTPSKGIPGTVKNITPDGANYNHEFEVPGVVNGNYKLAVYKPGCSGPMLYSVTVNESDINMAINLPKLPTSFTVSGTIKTWNSEDNAVVRIYSSSETSESIAADIKSATPSKGTAGTITEITADGTNYNHKFQVNGIANGNYKIAVYKPGCSGPYIGTFSVSNNSISFTSPIELPKLPESFTVGGTLISWNSANDAVIRLYNATETDASIKEDMKDGTPSKGTAVTKNSSITLNADGKNYDQKFSVSGVKNGSYKLAFYKPGYSVAIQSFDVNDSDMNFTMRFEKGEEPSSFKLTGTLTAPDSTNNAVIRLYTGTETDASIKSDIESASPSKGTEVTKNSSITLNADGKNYDQTFSLDGLAKGSYKLAVYKPGYGTNIQTVTFTDSNIELKIKFTGVPSGFTVSGALTAWDNTDNAVIRLYASTETTATIRTDIKSATPSKGEAAVKGSSVTANGGGSYDQSFSFAGIANGTYKLAVYKPGHGLSITTVTVSGTDVSQNVKIYLKGDVNGDGQIKQSDATILRKYLAGTIVLTEEQLIGPADVNGDGQIKQSDATILMKYLAGIGTIPA